jgi:hypothetical protein
VSLIEGNLAGHDSHGVIRLTQYVHGMERGQIDPHAQLEVLRDTPITPGSFDLSAVHPMASVPMGDDPKAAAVDSAGNVFVADAYTRRVLSRHRMVPADIGYEELRRIIEGRLPRDPALFNELHALLVAVAKSHCRARPRCEGCPLRFDLRGRRPRG